MSKHTCQLKVANLEKQLVEILDNVHSVTYTKSKAALDFYETRRRTFADGYYLYTIEEGNESHGVIIEKRTDPDGDAEFFLFDPNGQYWANHQNYHLTISHNGSHIEPDVSISPRRGWNPMGYCAIWTAVMAVFFANVGPGKPFDDNDSKLLYSYLDEHKAPFIDWVYKNLITDYRGDYTTASQARHFQSQVVSHIESVLAGLRGAPSSRGRTSKRSASRKRSATARRSSSAKRSPTRRSLSTKRASPKQRASPKARTRRSATRASSRNRASSRSRGLTTGNSRRSAAAAAPRRSARLQSHASK